MPQIPPAMNIGFIPPMVPSIMFKAPKEGPGAITFNVDWSIPLAKGLDAMNVNLQNQATLEFSQICGLIVDNSNCGSDLDFIFPDTDVTVSVPAYAPYTVLQVNTQQVQFFIRALEPIAGDLTHFSVLNYAPSPVAVPVFTQQQSAVASSITIDGTAVTQLVPASVSGSLRAFNISAAWVDAAADFNNLFVLRDGTGRTIWAGNLAGDMANDGQIVLSDMSNLNIRFQGGLQLIQSGGFTVNGTIDANIYYRVP